LSLVRTGDRLTLGSVRFKSNTGVRPIAIRFVLRRAASAKGNSGHAVDRSTGTRNDLDVAGNDERTIRGWRDREGSGTLSKSLALCCRGFTGCDKSPARMGSVAKRFVLGLAAPAQSGTIRDRAVPNLYFCMESQRTILAQGNEIDTGRRLPFTTIGALDRNRARRTMMGNLQQGAGRRGVRIDPRPLNICLENIRLPQHALPCMDAEFAVEANSGFLPSDIFNRVISHVIPL